MDNILLCSEVSIQQKNYICQLQTIKKWDLVVAPKKIQQTSPWKYLGMTLTLTVVRPQKLQFRTEVKIVNNVQKMAGYIQWVRNLCGITNMDMEPLFEMLHGSTAPREERHLPKEAG